MQMHPGVDFCTEYERSKVLADTIIMQEVKNGLPAVVVYPGVVYGPGQTTEANSLVSLVRSLAIMLFRFVM
jgi:farnesol dehydrogenase